MKGLYSRERYLEEFRKFEECNGLSDGIQERDKGRRSITSREEKRKTEGGRGRVEFRGREV